MLCDLKELSDAMKGAKAPMTEVALVDGKIDISNGFSVLRRIQPEKADDYPKPVELPSARNYVDRVKLLKALTHIMPCMSRDTTRYNLNGIQVKRHRGGLRLVATDGHRLACHFLPDCEIDGLENVGGDKKGEIVVPMGFWNALLPQLKKPHTSRDLRFGLDFKTLVATKDQTSVACRLIEGEFPNFAQVVPKGDLPNTLTVSGIEWETHLEDAMPSLKKGKGKYHVVVIEMGGDDTDECPHISSGDNLPKKHIPVLEIEQGTQLIRLGLNPSYLLDAIKGMEGIIKISVPNPPETKKGEDPKVDVMSPILMTNDNHQGFTVVMPCRP
jgi:DNA polymerase-3 subunit beta